MSVSLPNDFATYLSNNITLILVFVFLQGSLLIVLAVLFIEKIVTVKKRRLEDTLIKEQAYAEARVLLDNARKDAVREVEEAHAKAREILDQASSFNEHLKKQFEFSLATILQSQQSHLRDLSTTLSDEFKKTFEQERVSTIAEFDSVTNTFREDVIKQISQYKDTLEKATLETQKEIRTELQTQYAEVRKKVEMYEEESYENAKSKIYKIVEFASKSTLGHTIDLNSHEELVIKLLDKAKLHADLG